MKQEEKEQRLIGFASNFISLNDKRPHKQHYTESELADYMIYFAKSEAAKAYHQQKRFVRTENGTTLLELVFRKVDEHIKLENKNGWWDEYKGLMLRAEQEQTESDNLDDIDKLFNSMLEWVDDEFNKNLFIESFNYIKTKPK